MRTAFSNRWRLAKDGLLASASARSKGGQPSHDKLRQSPTEKPRRARKGHNSDNRKREKIGEKLCKSGILQVNALCEVEGVGQWIYDHGRLQERRHTAYRRCQA